MFPAGYKIEKLSKAIAEQHGEELAAMADQIPQVEYVAADIVAQTKGDRVLHAKWEHSFILMRDEQPVGFVAGYEREGEGNDQYPENTLYISELAIHTDHQQHGLGRMLLEYFFEINNSLGFVELEGEFNYSIQTNSAEWNAHVIKLYKSFGFIQRATKEYDNRTDVVLGMKPIAIGFVE